MFLGKKPMDIWLVAEMTILTICLAMGLRIPVLNLAALALCTWVIIFERSLDHIFDWLFYLVPFSPIFKIGLSGFALFNFVTIMVLFRLVMANDFAFSIPSASTFVMIIYILAGIMSAGIPDCIRFICQLLIGAIVMINPAFRNSLSIKRKNTMLASGILVSSLIASMRDFFPQLKSFYEYYGTTIRLAPGVHYARFMGLEMNPNMYTVLTSVSLAVFIVYLVNGRLKKFDIVLMGGIGIYGALTVSMSFIVSIIGIVGIAFIPLSRRNPRLATYTVVVGILGGIVFLVLFGDSDMVQTILFRFQEGLSDSADLSSVTTGRSDIWLEYLEYFWNHPFVALFGKGLNAKLPMHAPHNYYIETIYYLGIVGGILYIFTLADVYAPSKYIGRRCEFYQQIPLFMLLIRGIARCLICEEKMMFIFLIYSLTVIDTSDPKQPFGIRQI